MTEQPERFTEGSLALYHSGGEWTVADQGAWLAGVYDSRVAARAAASLSDEVIEEKLRPICMVDGGNRLITLADVQAATA